MLQWSRHKVRDASFNTVSERLDQFWRRDMSSIRKEIAPRLWPASYDRRLTRDVPMLHAIVRELATFYRLPARRRFETPTGEAFSPGRVATLERLYKALKVDQVMQHASEMAICQSTVLGLIRPRPGSDQLVVSLHAPFQFEVDPDPTNHTSLNQASAIRIQVPVSATHQQVTFGVMEIDPQARTAWYTAGGKRTGVYAEDGSMPGPDLPLFVVRNGPPPSPGDFMGPLATDLFDLQVSSSCAWNDLLHASAYSAAGTKILKGATRNQAAEIQLGADSVIGLDEDQEFQVVSAQSNTDSYLKAIGGFEEAITAAHALNPARFLKGSLTAVSKQMDLADRFASRQAQINHLVAAENSLLRAVLSVLSWGAGSDDAWPRGVVHVDHQEQPTPVDPQAEAQAKRMGYEDGYRSVTADYAQAAGISQEQARREVIANAEEYAYLRWAVPHRVSPMGATAEAFTVPTRPPTPGKGD